MALFRHIHRPLVTLFPKRSAHELGVTARSLFSAVHGMVMLGLEQKLIAVPMTPDAKMTPPIAPTTRLVQDWV